ncbi:MAG TPA: GNAT family N-acetyltransferase [Clostridia bacterium]
MPSKRDVLRIAREQLALDYNCSAGDFDREDNTIVANTLRAGRRMYSNDGCFFKAACFGRGAVVFADPSIHEWCHSYLDGVDGVWLFGIPRLNAYEKKLGEFGHELADMHHFYLPDMEKHPVTEIAPVKWFKKEEILQFKDDKRFAEAFSFSESQPDVLGLAAYEGDTIIGMAGASADSKTLWQIGIDVTPKYRGLGLGTYLVNLMKQEVLRHGVVPFYGTAESHIHSQNIALSAGFFPAWVEAYSKKKGT